MGFTLGSFKINVGECKMKLEINVPKVSYGLIIFAILFVWVQENDFILGDYIFGKLGLPVWSNGLEGIHYPVVFSLFLIVMALIGFMVYSKETSPGLKKLAFFTLFFGHLLIQPAFSEVYGMVKSFSPGLEAIDYYRSQSTSTFESTYDNKFLKINSKLSFVNYSQVSQEVYVKLLPDKYPERLTNDDNIIATDGESLKPKKFILHPKSQTTVNASFIAKPKEDLMNASGSFNGTDVIIYNDNQVEKFIRGEY